MRKIPLGEARLEQGEDNRTLRYAVVVDEVSTPCGGLDGEDSEVEIYGIEVSMEEETALVRGLTHSATQILSIVKALREAAVTPVHTREILEDVLLEA